MCFLNAKLYSGPQATDLTLKEGSGAVVLNFANPVTL